MQLRVWSVTAPWPIVCASCHKGIVCLPYDSQLPETVNHQRAIEALCKAFGLWHECFQPPATPFSRVTSDSEGTDNDR